MKDSWNPAQYEKFKEERSQPFLDLLQTLQPLPPKATALDLGSGTGELTALFHNRFHPQTTVGLERSEAMLNKATPFQSGGLSFLQGDIETWSASKTYDVIISNAALQWCRDHKNLLARIKEALKDQGQIAIQMPMNHDYATHVLAKKMSEEPHWNKLLKGEVYDKYSALLTPEEYAHVLFNLGFKKQNVFLKVYGHVLSSREDVVEWVKGSLLTYFQSRLTPEDYENFIKEFKERLFKDLPDEKPFFYPFKRLFIWAQL